MIKAIFIDSTTAQYTAEEFSWLQKFFLQAGILGDSSGNLGLAVSQKSSGANMSVDVAIGNALIDFTKNSTNWKVIGLNNAIVNVAIAANSSGSNRVDAIIMRASVTTEPNSLKNNIITIKRVAGTGTSALSDGAISTAISGDAFIRLANVTVSNGASSIVNANIADTRIQCYTNEAIKLAPKTINFSILSSDPITPVEGQVWYNSTTHTLCFFNGTITQYLGLTTGVLTINDIYGDGISASQTNNNAIVGFGLTDATGNNNKLYSSFPASKTILSSIKIKKGYPTIPVNATNNFATFTFKNSLADALSKSGSLTGAGSVSFVNDIYNNATSSRRYGASGYGKDTGNLYAGITGNFTLQTRYTKNSSSNTTANACIAEIGSLGSSVGFGIWLNNTSSTSNGAAAKEIHLRINGTYNANNSSFNTGYVIPDNVTVDMKYVYNGSSISFYKKEIGIDQDWVLFKSFAWTTNPSSNTNISIGCRNENTSDYVIGDIEYVAISNSATPNIFYGENTNSDVVINIYADNAGAPNTSSSLATVTIPAIEWKALLENVDSEIILSSSINTVNGNTYWIELSQTTPHDILYPILCYKNSNVAGYSLKRKNTTDGIVSITGSLYIKALITNAGKLVNLNNYALIPSDLFKDFYFGDGSDGDVVISSNTTLIRDMYYNNLTVNTGITLDPNGYKIFVKDTCTVLGTGKIARNGGDGTDGTTFSAGTGGSAMNSGSCGIGGKGGDGGYNGGAGGAGGSLTNSLVISNPAGTTSVTAATNTKANPIISIPKVFINDLAFNMKNTVGIFNGGAGGAGGNSSGQNGGYRGGGGGGTGGGVIFISASKIVLAALDSVQSKGGKGGQGGQSGLGNGADGGGGNGGAIVIICRKNTGFIDQSIACPGGLGGGSSSSTAKGNTGTVYFYKI